MKPTIAIIYLSFNSRPYLDEVFLNLTKLDYPRDRIKIFFVDNASTDGSVGYFRGTIMPQFGDLLPEVVIMPESKNTGFAGGNNIGYERARAEGFDYVYLHNNDAKLEPRCLVEAVKLAEVDESVGSVQSTMRLWQEPDRYNSTGNMYHFLGFGYCRDGYRLVSDISRADATEIAYPSCAAVLLRSSVLEKVGLFDERFFMYHEDSDLGLRIKLRGYKNVISAKSIAYHKYDFKRSIQKFYWMERNRILLLFKTLKPLTLLLILPVFVAVEFGTMVFSIKNGWGKEKLLSWIFFLDPRNWPYLIQARYEMQKLRVLRDRDVIKNFTGRMESQEFTNPIINYFINPIFDLYWRIVKKVVRW